MAFARLKQVASQRLRQHPLSNAQLGRRGATAPLYSRKDVRAVSRSRSEGRFRRRIRHRHRWREFTRRGLSTGPGYPGHPQRSPQGPCRQRLLSAAGKARHHGPPLFQPARTLMTRTVTWRPQYSNKRGAEAPLGILPYWAACSSSQASMSAISASWASITFWAICLAHSSSPCSSSALAMSIAP